jgi:hypothetical protein
MSDLPRTALERVLARAAELQVQTGDDSDSISEERLLDIAKEVGLDVPHVRQAIAEERAQMPFEAPESGVLLDALGPSMLSAQRTVPGTPAQVLQRLEAWLPRSELMQPVRRAGDRMIWEPRRDPLGNIFRSIGLGGRRFDLVRLDQLVVSATKVDDTRSVLRFVAIANGARRSQRTTGVVLGSVLAFLALFIIVPMFAFALAVPQVAAVTAALLSLVAVSATVLTWRALKRSYRALLGRVQTRLEFLLDESEHERLDRPPGLIERVLKSGF